QQLGNPRGIVHIALATRHVLHLCRVCQKRVPSYCPPAPATPASSTPRSLPSPHACSRSLPATRPTRSGSPWSLRTSELSAIRCPPPRCARTQPPSPCARPDRHSADTSLP